MTFKRINLMERRVILLSYGRIRWTEFLTPERIQKTRLSPTFRWIFYTVFPRDPPKKDTIIFHYPVMKNHYNSNGTVMKIFSDNEVRNSEKR